MTVFVDRRTSGLTLLSVEAIDGVRGEVCDAGRQKPGDDEMVHPEGRRSSLARHGCVEDGETGHLRRHHAGRDRLTPL